MRGEDIESAVRMVNAHNEQTAMRAEAGAWIAVVILVSLLAAVVIARCTL
jgi:hypothetical protein